MSGYELKKQEQGASIFLAILGLILSVVAIMTSVCSWYYAVASIAVLVVSILSVIICVYLVSKEIGGKLIPIIGLFGNKLAWVIVSFVFIGKAYVYLINYLGL